MHISNSQCYRIAVAFTLTLIFLFSVIPPATADPPKKVIYVAGLFEGSGDQDSLKKNLQVAQQIADAGYQAVVHAYLHVYPDGSLVLGGIPLVSAEGVINPDVKPMQQVYARLKSRGAKVLLAFGGGWSSNSNASLSDHDYSRLYAYTLLNPDKERNPVLDHIRVAREFFKFDGIDLDFEPYNCNPNRHCLKDYASAYYDDSYIGLLADFTRWAVTEQGMTITFAPFMNSEFWAILLTKTFDDNKGQLVSWLNLQGYGGADFDTWVEDLSPKKYKTGIPDIKRFISMGYSCADPTQNSPEDIKNSLHALKGVNSGFIWQGGNIVDKSCNGSFQDYADAITSGIGSK